MRTSIRSVALATALVALAGAGIPAAAAAPAGPSVSAAAASGAWQPGAATYDVGTQRNVAVTMADGTVLKANIYSPVDRSTGQAATGPFPVVLTMTPYGKDVGETDAVLQSAGMGEDIYLIQRGYIHVVVDARGTGASQGSWSFNQPVESSDAATIVNWTTTLPHSSSVVGTIGASYSAISQLLLAGRIGPGSPLKAVLPIVPSGDFYGDLAQGGTMTPLTLAAYAVANNAKSEQNALDSGLSTAKTPQDIAGLLDLLVSHTAGFGSLPATDWIVGGPQSYRTDYWNDRSPDRLLPNIVANDVPVMIVGGYRDAFSRSGPLLYAGLQNASAGRAADQPMLPNQQASPKFQFIEGPWYHQTITGAGSFKAVPINELALQWFDHWLKGVDTGITDTTTPFKSYDMTTNSWIQTNAYPFAAATQQKFYFAGSRTLTPTKPAAAGSDSILYSNIPLCTPSISQYTLIGDDERARLSAGLPANPCNEDDRSTQSAPFSTTYTTAPLASDQVIAGPIAAHIEARVSSLESEWVIRVEDVAPDGSSYPLTRGVLMGSLKALDQTRTWRAADGSIIRAVHPLTQASAQANVPGSLQNYDIEVLPIHATIDAGHSIRVTVSSDDSPSVFPSATQAVGLAGGVYQIQRGGSAASYVQIPLAAPGSLGAACTDRVFCPVQ